jgi:hypothetical protein
MVIKIGDQIIKRDIVYILNLICIQLDILVIDIYGDTELSIAVLPLALSLYNLSEVKNALEKRQQRERAVLDSFEEIPFVDVPIAGGAAAGIQSAREGLDQLRRNARRSQGKMDPSDAIGNLPTTSRGFGSMPVNRGLGLRNRLRRGGGSSSSSAAAGARDQDIIQRGLGQGMHPDDQQGVHQPMGDDPDADIKAAERAGRDFTRRQVYNGLRNALAGGATLGTLKGLLSRYRPTWQVEMTPDGKIKVTDDTGSTDIIDPSGPSSMGGVGGGGGSGSMVDTRYVGKFKFPKYARYNYARWAESTNEAARRTGATVMPMPPSVVKSRSGTGSRIVHIPNSGLGGI